MISYQITTRVNILLTEYLISMQVLVQDYETKVKNIYEQMLYRTISNEAFIKQHCGCNKPLNHACV